MGLAISKQEKTEDELAYLIRKQNCKVNRKIYSIIEKSYRRGLLTELEFQATIGWYHGLKFRHLTAEEEIFIAGLDKIYELVCNLIQEKYADKLRAKAAEKDKAAVALPSAQQEPLDGQMSDKMAETFGKILNVNPYEHLMAKLPCI